MLALAPGAGRWLFTELSCSASHGSCKGLGIGVGDRGGLGRARPAAQARSNEEDGAAQAIRAFAL